jgi:putative DNA methylase
VTTVKTRKKLIEVALPLEAINVASAREKSIRQGHPSTLHLYWARRPLAAARAVIFAQMVDDPSANPDLFITEKAQDKERKRLFKIIEELVKWENTTNEEVLQSAHEEIKASWRRACADNADHPQAKELFDRNKLPGFHDPFAGGGSLPLEAQRLGLESYATDLNPVAVLINKVMIEIAPKFSGKTPLSKSLVSSPHLNSFEWQGARGLAEDVTYFSGWIKDEVEKKLKATYPDYLITEEIISQRPELQPYRGKKLKVISWLWARTVRSPNPAYPHVHTPLASTFVLCSKKGHESYVEVIKHAGGYRFVVRLGAVEAGNKANNGTKHNRANFECIMSGVPVSGDYIKSEATAGKMGSRLMAVVCEGDKGRIYLDPNDEHEAAAFSARPESTPEVLISGSTQYVGVKPYGMTRFDQIHTPRQMLALETFSSYVSVVREKLLKLECKWDTAHDPRRLESGGLGLVAYADAVAICLSMCVSRQANRSSTLNVWDQQGENVQQVFGMQAYRMTWDYVEGNPFSSSTGNFNGQAEYFTKALTNACSCKTNGFANQADAQTQNISFGKVISTDPPYYDNVPYADLSDFFYVWLRRSLASVMPHLFSTIAVPKTEELVAFAYRHDGKTGAEAFFLNGMTEAMGQLAKLANPAFPVTIYYAFRQSEKDESDGIASTGWETFLAAVAEAGFSITGTWPMRTEYTGNLKTKRNALASSIVLVCRAGCRVEQQLSRRDFVAALKAELPIALVNLQQGNIAPVDLAQASIGPGMSIYTRYAKILGADGGALSVRDALLLINEVIDEQFGEQETNWDHDTRWAVTWFEQFGFDKSNFGDADKLSKAKNTSVSGLVLAGIIQSNAGSVHLLKPEELPSGWNPLTDERLTVWEMTHHLIRLLKNSESSAAALIKQLGDKAESARELAYRLYRLCETKKRAELGIAYNQLVQVWPDLVAHSKEASAPSGPTGELNLDS